MWDTAGLSLPSRGLLEEVKLAARTIRVLKEKPPFVPCSDCSDTAEHSGCQSLKSSSRWFFQFPPFDFKEVKHLKKNIDYISLYYRSHFGPSNYRRTVISWLIVSVMAPYDVAALMSCIAALEAKVESQKDIFYIYDYIMKYNKWLDQQAFKVWMDPEFA